MYSASNEDLITIGIKIGICSIYTRDYQFGMKYVKDAISKNDEHPTSKARTSYLNTIQALILLGYQKFDKVCSFLWEKTTSTDQISDLVST